MSSFFQDLGTGAVPWYLILIAAVCTYFLGNINPAILFGRKAGVDIRAQGSGNAGATNVVRALGRKAGAIVFGIDVAKGFVGFLVPLLVFGDYPVAMLCGLCVVLGHMYPALFGFRGGKGVATTFGALLAASWIYALILLAIVIVLTLLFRRVSLSVIIAAFAGVAMFVFHAPFITKEIDALWAIILFILVVWKHRANIERLIDGNESKLELGFLNRKREEVKAGLGEVEAELEAGVAEVDAEVEAESKEEKN